MPCSPVLLGLQICSGSSCSIDKAERSALDNFVHIACMQICTSPLISRPRFSTRAPQKTKEGCLYLLCIKPGDHSHWSLKAALLQAQAGQKSPAELVYPQVYPQSHHHLLRCQGCAQPPAQFKGNMMSNFGLLLLKVALILVPATVNVSGCLQSSLDGSRLLRALLRIFFSPLQLL